MHELSICQALIEQVEAVAREQDAVQVVQVRIGIGPLSGVEPQLLEQAFQLARAGSIAATASLLIDPLPVRVSCRECGQDYYTVGRRKDGAGSITYEPRDVGDVTAQIASWLAEAMPEQKTKISVASEKPQRAGIQKQVTPHILRHTFGRPFGRLVNVSSDTARHQGCASSPWQSKKPSNLGLVSFQGTRASRAKEVDFQ